MTQPINQSTNQWLRRCKQFLKFRRSFAIKLIKTMTTLGVMCSMTNVFAAEPVCSFSVTKDVSLKEIFYEIVTGDTPEAVMAEIKPFYKKYNEQPTTIPTLYGYNSLSLNYTFVGFDGFYSSKAYYDVKIQGESCVYLESLIPKPPRVMVDFCIPFERVEQIECTVPTCPAPANGQRAAATDCTCPVEPLKPITDPETLRFENGDTLREDKLASSMKTKLACLRNAVSKAGGTLTVNSAWRPIGYQEHFYEIFTKFNELNKPENKKIAACKPIRDQVIFEKNTKHGIQGKVAKPSESRHEKGLAFDASWSNITTAKLDALLPSCNLTRPFKKTDKIHFQ